MRLQALTRLGPYEILSSIGAGGMGEVYRALDTRLDRIVAIKVLRKDLIGSPDIRARFEREARVVSSLNHPHICVLFDVGQEADTDYLVMEYVEGETLEKRLSRGALPLEQSMLYGVQIAGALDHAHRTGIVHRDLKPGNIMLTKHGVKVLDFGLAKAHATPPNGEVSAQKPTLKGVILGTPEYAAPEQLRGGAADQRADIFALGAVMYEMTAGRSAFQGENVADVMTAVLCSEPSLLSAVRPSVPGTLAHVVQRCLAKDPEERWQTARDVMLELEWIGDGDPTTPQPPPSHAPRIAWSVVALLTMTAALLVFFYFRRAVPSQPSFEQLTFGRVERLTSRFTPDGSTIVYSAKWAGHKQDIFMTRAETTDSRALGLENATLASVSSTGELAIIQDKDQTLARVAITGKTAREVMRNVIAADWAPDGSSMMVLRQGGNRTYLEFPIGRLLYETDSLISYPRLSRDGKRIAFYERVRSGSPTFLKILDTSKNIHTISGPWAFARGLVWSPNGREVWFSASLRGPPSPHAVDMNGKSRSLFPWPFEIEDAAVDGRVLFRIPSLGSAEMLYGSAAHSGETDMSWHDFTVAADLSADGTTILFDEAHNSGRGEGSVYIRKNDGSAPVKIGSGRALALSPNGFLALTLKPRSDNELMLLPVGAGETVTLNRGRMQRVSEARWFSDGKHVLLWGNEEGRAARHFVTDIADGEPRPLTPEGASAEAAISPDGRLVASSSSSGIVLYPVSGGTPTTVRGGDDSAVPIAWSADGQLLYVRRPSRPQATIDRLDMGTGRREFWKELGPLDPVGLVSTARVSITPDGRSYVYSCVRFLFQLHVATGLQ